MTNATDSFAAGDSHDAPHRPVLSQLLGEQWMLTFEATGDGSHTQFALLYGESSREVVSCFAGEPADPSEAGCDAESVLDVVAHVVWHVREGVLPGHCDED